MAKKTFSTDRQVANLKRITGQLKTDYSHKTEVGLVLRVGATQKSWRVTYSINGKRNIYTLPLPYPQCTLEQATKECRRIRGEALKGDDPLQERKQRKKSLSVADVMTCYIEETPLKPEGKKEALRSTKTDINRILGQVKAIDLKRHHVKDLHKSIVDRGSPVMANRTIQLMQRAFKHAFDEEYIPTNTFPSIKKILVQETTRERVLTDEELSILWQAMENLRPNMRDIHKLLLLTGQRTNDVCSMRITDIDPTKKTWTVPAPPRGKNKNPNVLPLCSLAWEIIEPRLQQEGEWIFPSNYNTTRAGYFGTGHAKNTKASRRRLIQETGVVGWTGHDLRRTLRTMLSILSIAPHIAERVIGHSQGGVEAIYDRYTYVEEKRRALDKIDRHIRKIVGLEQKVAKLIQLPRASNS